MSALFILSILIKYTNSVETVRCFLALHNAASLYLSESPKSLLATVQSPQFTSRSRSLDIPPPTTKFFTFGRWLHGDLVAEVTSACSGHSCSPDQVLLPVVEVGDSVEEKLWVGFILAGHLRRHRSRVQGQLLYLTLLYFMNSATAFYQSLRNTGNQFVVG